MDLLDIVCGDLLQWMLTLTVSHLPLSRKSFFWLMLVRLPP